MRFVVAGESDESVGRGAVEYYESPKNYVLPAYVVESGAVVVYVYETVDAPCGRDKRADHLPEWIHGIARPCDSGEKEEDDGGEYYQQ